MAVNDGGPTLSIGIPVHNGARYLAHTLDSLRAAELDDVEILISDNASTDETGDIVRSAAFADPRLRYIRQPENIGPAENFNYVFRNTTGTFFSWLAYDDLIEPTFYRQMVEMLNARPDAAAAMSRVRLIDSSGGLMDHSDELVEGDHPDAVERFIRYAGFAHWCQFCYGVARRSAMEKRRLLGTYWSGDRLYCAELALAGPLLRPSGDTLFRSPTHGPPDASAQPTGSRRGDCVPDARWVSRRGPYTTRRSSGSRWSEPPFRRKTRRVVAERCEPGWFETPTGSRAALAVRRSKPLRSHSCTAVPSEPSPKRVCR